MVIINVAHVGPLGGSFFGTLLIALCFGVLTIQTSSYYHAFPNDGRSVKLVVAILWTLEAFQLVCCTRSLYWWFVTNYHNSLALEWAPWEFAIYPLNVACSSVIAQTFFTYRVYSLSANLYAGVLLQVLVLLQFGFSAANAIKSTMLGEFQMIDDCKECTWLVKAWLIIQAIADVVIATYMCLLLRRRRTGFQKTDSVINRMVLYTISTGLVTSILSCVGLVLFAKYGVGFSVLIIGMPLGGFYSITVLTNLHMRARLRVRLDTPSPLELFSSSMKKRILQNAGDHGSEESTQATTDKYYERNSMQ
ncbi:hypothetical protein BS47DRAFT_54287 [Hydnum rufescens UP504]|uniref:DUF6534 domain-containing protein n=1 Tax=Hydnum rufescens UP504 TaxID=1448309 RepID=A0A9P6DTJ5_9AGAM|nr:hypothetical protein BS47DRAFT_54287 [Hydnum rufescens UP504]